MANCGIHNVEEYLIIISGDEYAAEKERSEVVDLDSNKYYVYRRGEFLGGKLGSRDLNLKKIAHNIGKMKELAERVSSDLLGKKFLTVPEVIENCLIFTRDFKLDKHMLIGKLLHIKKVMHSYIRDKFCSIMNDNKLERLVRETIRIIDFALEKANFKMEKSGKLNVEKFTTLKSESNTSSSVCSTGEGVDLENITNEVEFYGEKSLTEGSGSFSIDKEHGISTIDDTEKGFSEDSIDSLEESDSNISLRSEPVTNIKIKRDLLRKSGTVINAEIKTDDEACKVKYQELLESYRNISIGSEVKENMNANKV